MKLTSRDRRAVAIGGIIAGAILVIAYVVAPLARIWFDKGTELGPKLAYVDRLRERVHQQDSLLRRREVLVRRLGSVLGPGATEMQVQSVVPTAAAAAGEQEKPGDSEEESAPADEAAVTASPESTESDVAGEREERGDSEEEVAPADEATVTAGSESTERPAAGEQEEPGDSESEVSSADEAAVAASPAPTETAVAGEQEEPGDSEVEGAPADEAAVTASPESTETAVAGEQEKPEESGVETAPQEEAGPEAAKRSGGVSLAAHLERAADKSGVKIERISPKKQSRGTRGTGHFKSVALQVRLESNMQNLIKLLHALEKGERFVRVEQIQVRRDLKKGDRMQVSLDIVGYESVTR